MSDSVSSDTGELREIRRKFLLGLEFFGVAAITALLLWHLLHPLGDGHAAAGPVVISEPSEKDYLLDCFILRDVSTSPRRKAQYDTVETSLFDNLSTEAGDRISYAVFGSGTEPNPIQPPSTHKESIEVQRSLAKQVSYNTTDFASLFTRLRETILKDRQAQVTDNPPPHADAIILLSDGIPDLTPGRSHCPDGSDTFIPEEVVTAFGKLINDPYATQDLIYVRLIIIGAPPLCGSRIAQEWETRLGSKAFKALLYSTDNDIVQDLLTSLRRQPRIIFSLGQLDDEERESLDQEAKFAIHYSARSFSLREPGTLQIKNGVLIPRAGEEEEGRRADSESGGGTKDDAIRHEIPLLAGRYPKMRTTDESSRVDLTLPPPLGRSLLGKSVPGYIYLKLEDQDDKKYLSELSNYDLRLEEEKANYIVEYRPAALSLKPCRKALSKSEVFKKLKPLVIASGVIGFVFLIGWIYWSAAWINSAKKSKRLYFWIEKALVKPYRHWIELLLIIAIPVTLSLLFLHSTASLVCIGVILGLVLYYLGKVQESPKLHMVFFTIEYLTIPLLHLFVAAK